MASSAPWSVKRSAARAPCPGRSTATDGWPRRAMAACWCAQIADDVRTPCTKTIGWAEGVTLRVDGRRAGAATWASSEGVITDLATGRAARRAPAGFARDDREGA